jgi:predicted PurR-regulated permease PerM
MKKRGSIVGSVKSAEFGKYFFWAFVILLIMLSYLILRPYLLALLSAFILSYLVRPVYEKLEGYFGKALSALISIILILVIVILPIGLIVGALSNEVYTYFSGEDFKGMLRYVSSSGIFERFGIDLGSLSGGDSRVVSLLTSAASYVPSFILTLFIILFGMYYILISWNDLARSLKRYIPFKDKDRVSKEIAQITNVMVYGTLLMAFFEGLIAGFGFYLLGIKFSVLLASLVFIFAFIPSIGPTVVWIPLALYFFFINNYFVAFGVLVIGLILSLIIDTILRAKILGNKARINPLVIILGILGGISVFGLFGFIIGPLILAYTIEILEEAVRK